MSDTQAPPGGGKHKLDPKKVKLIAAGVVVIGGYFWWRSKQAAAAAAATPADATTTDTGLGVPTDTGPGAYGTDYSAASSSTVGAVSTNQDWYQAALTACEDAGYDSGTASTALSLYLGNQPLTAAQQTIVRIGLAAAGSPPVGTFSIITAPASSTTTTPPAATSYPAVTNVRVPQRTTHTITIAWTASAPAPPEYTVSALTMTGKRIMTASTTGNAFQFTGLNPNTEYDLQVWSGPLAATSKHASVFARTTV